MPWIGLVVTAVVLAAATTLGLLLRRRTGQFRVTGKPAREIADDRTRAAMPEVADPLLAALGVEAGTPVTLLQFSSAFCGPCRTTRVLCADVAARFPGVRHIEVDAESNLDTVRALDIWRTPTVLIIDERGRERRRASGAPSRAQLFAAVADVLAATDRVDHDREFLLDGESRARSPMID